MNRLPLLVMAVTSLLVLGSPQLFAAEPQRGQARSRVGGAVSAASKARAPQSSRPAQRATPARSGRTSQAAAPARSGGSRRAPAVRAGVAAAQGTQSSRGKVSAPPTGRSRGSSVAPSTTGRSGTAAAQSRVRSTTRAAGSRVTEIRRESAAPPTASRGVRGPSTPRSGPTRVTGTAPAAQSGPSSATERVRSATRSLGSRITEIRGGTASTRGRVVRGRGEPTTGPSRVTGAASTRAGPATDRVRSTTRALTDRMAGSSAAATGGRITSGAVGATTQALRRRSNGNVVGRAVPRDGALPASPRYSDGRSYGSYSGYRYGFNNAIRYRSRSGFGHHQIYNPVHHHHHRHVYYPGYSYPSLYGSFFYLPGYSLNVGVSYGYGSYGYRHSGYAYPYGYYPYTYTGYGYGSVADPYTGFLRLKVHPRDAQVFVDGYYVGIVDEFDGIFQRLRLEEGPHHIEIRHPAYLPLELEVLIVVGEKVTYEGYLDPR